MEKHIHGGDVYHHQGCIDFSANCNPLGTPEGIKKAIIKSLEHINDYPQVGCTPLKKAIAEYENTKPDQVICGNGAAEVIFSLCRAVNPRRALVPAPTFAEYQQALYSVDCQVEFFLLNGKKRFVLEENFLQALTEEIDIIFLCNPNNPTGLLVEKPLNAFFLLNFPFFHLLLLYKKSLALEYNTVFPYREKHQKKVIHFF